MNRKQLIGLPVKTKSGLRLGRVRDFEFNTNNSVLEKYIVSSFPLVDKLVGTGELVISRSQVIEINENEMIVDDLFTEGKVLKEAEPC